MASFSTLQDLTTLKRKHYGILAAFMKASPKVSSLAPIVMDPENFQEFLVKFQIMISTIPALEIVLNYLAPTDDDRPFQLRLKNLLAEKNRKKTNDFVEMFESAKQGFLLAQNILVAYLLLCAGSNKSMCRTIMNYPSNPELALNDLANDYRKTSANNAITLKSELLNSTIVTNCEDMIEEMESKRTMILEMGRAIDDGEMADVALKAAKDHPRYQTDIAAYLTQLHREGNEAEWGPVKTYLKGLDRTTVDPDASGKAMAIGAKPKKKRQSGESTVINKALVAAVVEELSKDRPSLFPPQRGRGGGRDGGKGGYVQYSGRGAYRNTGRGGRFGRGGGDGRGTGGRFNSNQRSIQPQFQGNCHRCGKFGHRKADCWSTSEPVDGSQQQLQSRGQQFQNPQQFQQSTQAPPQQQSYANVAIDQRNSEYRSDYSNVLERASSRQRMFVMTHRAFLITDAPWGIHNVVLDSGADHLYIWDSKHRIEPYRLVSRPVHTAGGGVLTSIREGYHGNVRVMGMPDELSMQLCGVTVLMELGYEVIFSPNSGCMLVNPTTGYALCVERRDGLYIFDIRNILEWLETFDPTRHNRSDVISMEPSNTK